MKIIKIDDWTHLNNWGAFINTSHNDFEFIIRYNFKNTEWTFDIRNENLEIYEDDMTLDVKNINDGFDFFNTSLKELKIDNVLILPIDEDDFGNLLTNDF